jgi:hypothetical protein
VITILIAFSAALIAYCILLIFAVCERDRVICCLKRDIADEKARARSANAIAEQYYKMNVALQLKMPIHCGKCGHWISKAKAIRYRDYYLCGKCHQRITSKRIEV